MIRGWGGVGVIKRWSDRWGRSDKGMGWVGVIRGWGG